VSAWPSDRTYALLAALQAGDAVACAARLAPIEKVLDDVGLPAELRPIIPAVKAASAVGLLAVFRFPALARLTTVMLTVYFAVAVGAHVRVRDWGPGIVAASSFLALYGAMAAKGPSRGR
jgi:DoxX-like family